MYMVGVPRSKEHLEEEGGNKGRAAEVEAGAAPAQHIPEICPVWGCRAAAQRQAQQRCCSSAHTHIHLHQTETYVHV